MSCVICLGDITDNLRANTECGHTFHTKCLLENIVKGQAGHNCPMCRAELCPDVVVSIKEENEILEGAVYFLEEELKAHQDWVLYFHDLSDELHGLKLKQTEELKYLHKKVNVMKQI